MWLQRKTHVHEKTIFNSFFNQIYNLIKSYKLLLQTKVLKKSSVLTFMWFFFILIHHPYGIKRLHSRYCRSLLANNYLFRTLYIINALYALLKYFQKWNILDFLRWHYIFAADIRFLRYFVNRTNLSLTTILFIRIKISFRDYR